jgi:hypothetical protein
MEGHGLEELIRAQLKKEMQRVPFFRFWIEI